MDRQEFLSYVIEHFVIDMAAYRLIENILTFVGEHYPACEQYGVLCELLEGTIGLSDEEIRKIDL